MKDFDGKGAEPSLTRAMVRQVDEARWALQVHRTNHPRAASIDFARRLIEMLEIHRGLH